MTKYNAKLSVLEKIGYSLGDLAANLIFQTLVTYIAFFYTDVFEIPADIAGSIIFIGGVVGGALFSILMGIIADRTKTKWGKFRPWILWTAVPFGIISLLTFTVPDFDLQGKIVYAYITYFLLVLIYSANNLPYSALSGVLTGNMKERNSLSSYRFVAVMVAQFIVQALLLPMILYFGDGDKAEGFKIVMTIFAIAGVIMFLITFFTTKERIAPPVEQKTSIKQDLTDLMGNQPWVIMLFLTTIIFITLALKGGAYIYYFENYLSQEAMYHFLQTVNLAPNDPAESYSNAFSIFNGGGIIFMIVGIMVSKPLADKFGKREVFKFGLFFAAVFVLVFLFFPKDAIFLILGSQMLHGFFYGLTIPLLWAMIADVADFSEMKNNRRATAMVFSAMIFGLKIGLAVGGSLLAWILAKYGYNTSLESQSAETIRGIQLCVSLYPAILFFLGVASLFFYQIDRKMEIDIEKELANRRAETENIL